MCVCVCADHVETNALDEMHVPKPFSGEFGDCCRLVNASETEGGVWGQVKERTHQRTCSGISSNDPPRTRTWNLRLRRPTPYPLGQRASVRGKLRACLTRKVECTSVEEEETQQEIQASHKVCWPFHVGAMMTDVHGQFARVVKGVDLRSTAGNCAWVRTPQLTKFLYTT